MHCRWLFCVTIVCAAPLIPMAPVVAQSDATAVRIAEAGSMADRLLALGLPSLGNPYAGPRSQSIVPAQGDTDTSAQWCKKDSRYPCCCLWQDLDAADCVDPSVCAARGGTCQTHGPLPITQQVKNNCPIQ